MEPVMGLKRLRGWAKRAWGRQPRQKRWLEEDSKVREVARSTAGFVLGMALASLYGALVLLAQSGNLWYCLVTTISLGTALGLGMAFSTKVRVSVLLTLPHIFTSKQPGSRSRGHGRCQPPAEPQGHPVLTGEGKMLLLLLAFGMAVQGPCTNILHNFSRAAESLSCARALRNVWRWLASVGELCNQELGTPFRRCLRLFEEAKDNCERALSFLFFLCYIIITFRPLCGLANVGLLFCIIPQYIQSFLKKMIAAPLSRALDRVRREFEFNISAVHHFDISLNSSKTLADVALDIMEGVSRHLEPTRQVVGLFACASSCAILYLYLKALRYRHRYLRDDTFDNIYITQRFMDMDVQRAEQGKPTVLPLNFWESDRYIHPGMPWLSQQERRRYVLELTGVLRHVLLGLSLVLADYSLFWLLDLVRHQMQGEIVARAPAMLAVSVDGTGYTSEIFQDLVSAFDVLQQGNVSVLSQRCLLQPASCTASASSLPSLATTWDACGGWCVPLTTRLERTSFLYNTILARRAGLVHALHKAARMNSGDAAQGNLLLFLTSRQVSPLCASLGTAGARVPAFARLVRLLGIQWKHCMACGMAEQKDFIACITPDCKGLYCRECHQTLNNVCSICMGPLSYKDMGDEEMDSSDEETVGLWLGALRTLRGHEQEELREQGRLLRQRIQEVAGGRGGARRLPPELLAQLRARLKEEASEESDGDSYGVPGEDSSFSRRLGGCRDTTQGSGDVAGAPAVQWKL
ncbi:DC-STAMP domain-containing protein 2 [Aix galericulata]|nr:DC-STAMP domain-containing protein 2 [Aix galericulata]